MNDSNLGFHYVHMLIRFVKHLHDIKMQLMNQAVDIYDNVKTPHKRSWSKTTHVGLIYEIASKGK